MTGRTSRSFQLPAACMWDKRIAEPTGARGDRSGGLDRSSTTTRCNSVAGDADFGGLHCIGADIGTTTKQNPDPVVGTELIRSVRGLTKKPIVAIGGITLERAAEVIEAGADSVAVISVFCAADPAQRARQFIRRLEAVKSTASH